MRLAASAGTEWVVVVRRAERRRLSPSEGGRQRESENLIYCCTETTMLFLKWPVEVLFPFQ